MLFLKERIGRIIEDLQRMTYPQTIAIEHFKIKKTRERFPDVNQLNTDDWEVFSTDHLWGGHREYFWFDTTVVIPPSFDGKCAIFELTTGKEGGWDAKNPQFSLYIDGQLRQGLDVNHRQVVITENAAAGTRYRLTLSAYTGDHNDHLLFQAQLREVDRLTEKYCYDINVPLGVAERLDEQDPAYLEIIQALNDSVNLLDLRREYSAEYYRTLSLAQDNLTAAFYDRLCGKPSPVVCCVGHTHIDVAWLWTLAVTEDKAVRSFATVLKLMEEYPEYIFMSSQPQLYKYVQKNAPDLFEKIRCRVQEGRWEPEGAMFVEADCNIASGEALVRQILTGKRFFQQEFASDNKVLWLPDVFGYSAALPQIMKKSGLDYFMTTKISWNELNKMPYDTFDWIGIDGSRVLTHFITASDYKTTIETIDPKAGHYTTYNGNLNASQVMGGWQRYQQKHLGNEVMMSFGYGDGGGGPTREMLENQRRLSRGIPGAPKTRMSTARQFFENLERQAGDDPRLPAWSGELYLEYHRGTYTTMARNKKFNRRSEFALQNAEWISTLNALLNQAAYPADEIRQDWEILLRNQFHDILPGSSIKEVYEDSKAEYEKLLSSAGSLIIQALKAIATRVGDGDGYVEGGSKDSAGADRKVSACNLVVFNPNGSSAAGFVTFTAPNELKKPCLKLGDSQIECQPLENGEYLACLPHVPAKGFQKFELLDAGKNPVENTTDSYTFSSAFSSAVSTAPVLQLTPDHLANAFFDIRLNDKGQFTSLYDKRANRELIQNGRCANVLMSFEDKPHNYDAWDINHYYQEKSWPVDDVQSIRITEAGPVRGCLQIRRCYLDSTIVQSIYIWRDLPRIDIRHEIDWKEKQVLLKEFYPVDIHTDQATFDIQYGNVQRATHRNTSWDFARFEVCMHKWLDLSEDGYGLSILNDSKYGCSVHNGEIGISLLKSAISPNPDADKEHHDFILTLLPHTGDWRQAGTVQQAYSLNNPLMAVLTDPIDPAVLTEQTDPASAGHPSQQAPPKYPALPQSFSLVQADQENIIIKVVKKAEDSDDWIIRFYECYNRRTQVRLTFAWPIERIAECDLMENDQEELQAVETGEKAGCAVDLLVKPFEIRTIKVRFKA